MSNLSIAIKSLLFHRQVNLAIALGVAAATAVLTGALIVGDSMRGSLRDLTLDRLGKIDLMLVSDGFFREALASELKSSAAIANSLKQVAPIIYFPNGTVERSQKNTPKNLGQVTLMGIRPDFWDFANTPPSDIPKLAANEVIINQILADDLGITTDQLGDTRLTVGVPKQSLLPSDSSLGNKSDLVERLVDLKVVDIIPATGLGQFGLQPTQIPPRLIYLPITTLQDALTDGLLKYKASRQQANVLLISKQQDTGDDTQLGQQISKALSPTLADLGLSLKLVSQSFDGKKIFEYLSLSSDRLVLPEATSKTILKAFPDAIEVFTYLANDLVATASPSDDENPSNGVPFSMVTAIDFGQVPLRSQDGQTVQPLGENEIAVNSWTAKDQDLKVGDRLQLTYFEPETTHGDEKERHELFTVSEIIPITEPSEPPRVNRRTGIRPAVFSEAPTRANDPDFTPTVPGLTDADSIERWDLPFETADRIRPQDDDYWTDYRTTPKAFISLATARRLWSSRFGDTTSFQISTEHWNKESCTTRLMDQFRKEGDWPGLSILPIKANGLAASSGATPFDALFLSLSMFVIASALALVSLLFRLSFQKRATEMGTLLAVGFSRKRVAKIWMIEMLGICLIGSLMGVLLGVGYAAVMIYGLKTWWLGAITTPFLKMHIRPITLPLGLGMGLASCAITILLSVRSARKQSVRGLLAGVLSRDTTGSHIASSKRITAIIGICSVSAVVLTLLAATLWAGESQAGAFMGSGFLILIAALLAIYRWVSRLGRDDSDVLSLTRLAFTNAGRNPLRSTLTIGLVAVASFLILAISAFRLSPTEQGTAGFNYLATTSSPIFANLDSESGQNEILIGPVKQLSSDSRVLSFRLKGGEDASCNNPYQASQPRVLGVTEATMDYFDDPQHADFSFSMTAGENPWRLLNEKTESGAIPVIIDKNTAWYNLKVYLPGTEFKVKYNSGETVDFRLVGLLNNSVLQGSLLVSEANFTKIFPTSSGYRTFLMNLQSPQDLELLSQSLSEKGFDAQDTNRLLAGYLAVQNTYLSTFQSLGLLGLLLGTLGLGAVQIRSILERRKELGLMRAIGFTHTQLAQMIMVENAWLLIAGMVVGMIAAMVTTLPHYFFGDASPPWQELVFMFFAISLVGLTTTWLASQSVFKTPLIQSLRSA